MKINCEIIQDLIPSYVDEICSNSTKECVEEHIAECDECRELVNVYRKNDFSANSLEKKQLDGLKKLKKKVKLQNLLSYGLLVGVIIFGIYTMELNYNPIPTIAYYILFAVLMLATNVITSQHAENTMEVRDKIMLAVSVVSIVYGLFMYCFVIVGTLKNNNPFGMEDSDIGPFLHMQTGIVLLVLIGTFGYVLYEFVRKNKCCNSILNVNLTGIFLMLAHTTLLRKLTDASVYLAQFAKVTVIIIVIGAVGVIIQNMVGRRGSKL